MDKVELKKSPIHRYGIFAKQNIKSNEILDEYPGIIVPDIEYHENNILSDYLYDISNYIPNTSFLPFGNMCIYNHSDKANARMAISPDEEIARIISIKDIKIGEEIVVDYGNNWSSWFKEERMAEVQEFEKFIIELKREFYNEKITFKELTEKLNINV